MKQFQQNPNALKQYDIGEKKVYKRLPTTSANKAERDSIDNTNENFTKKTLDSADRHNIGGDFPSTDRFNTNKNVNTEETLRMDNTGIVISSHKGGDFKIGYNSKPDSHNQMDRNQTIDFIDKGDAKLIYYTKDDSHNKYLDEKLTNDFMKSSKENLGNSKVDGLKNNKLKLSNLSQHSMQKDKYNLHNSKKLLESEVRLDLSEDTHNNTWNQNDANNNTWNNNDINTHNNTWNDNDINIHNNTWNENGNNTHNTTLNQNEITSHNIFEDQALIKNDQKKNYQNGNSNLQSGIHDNNGQRMNYQNGSSNLQSGIHGNNGQRMNYQNGNSNLQSEMSYNNGQRMNYQNGNSNSQSEMSYNNGQKMNYQNGNSNLQSGIHDNNGQKMNYQNGNSNLQSGIHGNNGQKMNYQNGNSNLQNEMQDYNGKRMNYQNGNSNLQNEIQDYNGKENNINDTQELGDGNTTQFSTKRLPIDLRSIKSFENIKDLENAVYAQLNKKENSHYFNEINGVIKMLNGEIMGMLGDDNNYMQDLKKSFNVDLSNNFNEDSENLNDITQSLNKFFNKIKLQGNLLNIKKSNRSIKNPNKENPFSHKDELNTITKLKDNITDMKKRIFIDEEGQQSIIRDLKRNIDELNLENNTIKDKLVECLAIINGDRSRMSRLEELLKITVEKLNEMHEKENKFDKENEILKEAQNKMALKIEESNHNKQILEEKRKIEAEFIFDLEELLKDAKNQKVNDDLTVSRLKSLLEDKYSEIEKKNKAISGLNDDLDKADAKMQRANKYHEMEKSDFQENVKSLKEQLQASIGDGLEWKKLFVEREYQLKGLNSKINEQGNFKELVYSRSPTRNSYQATTSKSGHPQSKWSHENAGNSNEIGYNRSVQHRPNLIDGTEKESDMKLFRPYVDRTKNTNFLNDKYFDFNEYQNYGINETLLDDSVKTELLRMRQTDFKEPPAPEPKEPEEKGITFISDYDLKNMPKNTTEENNYKAHFS